MLINTSPVTAGPNSIDNPSKALESQGDINFANLLTSNLKGVLKELNADVMEAVGARFVKDERVEESRPDAAIEGQSFSLAGATPNLLQTGVEGKASSSVQTQTSVPHTPTSAPKNVTQETTSSNDVNAEKEESAYKPESTAQNTPKREEPTQQSQKQTRELGSLIQAASDKAAADPGSFASLATARFAAMRQDQRQIVEALRTSEKSYGLQGVQRSDPMISGLSPLGAGNVGAKNGLAATQEVFGKGTAFLANNDDNHKNFEVFFDRKANSANISVNHERHGQIKLKVDVSGNEVQLMLLSKDAEVQQLISSNMQALKDQLAQKGLTLSFGFEGQQGSGNQKDRQDQSVGDPVQANSTEVEASKNSDGEQGLISKA